MWIIKNWINSLIRSHKINIKRKFFLATIFFTFFIFSLTILIFTITPSSFKSYLNDPRLNPSSNYNSYVEYPDFPGNSGGSESVPHLSLDEALSHYVVLGIQSGAISSDNTHNFIVPKIKDNLDGKNDAYKYYTKYRGLSTYVPDNLNSKDKLSITNTSPGVYKGIANTNYFKKLLDYFNLNNKGKVFPMPKNIIEEEDAKVSEALMGMSLQYLRGQNISSSFFRAFNAAEQAGGNLPFLKNLFGYALGVKYKAGINPKTHLPDPNNVIWYGGNENSTPLSSPSQILQQGILQQFTASEKNKFYKNNISVNFGNVPYNNKNEELYTYLNGMYNNTAQKVWGINFNNTTNNPLNREDPLVNKTGGSRYDLLDDNNININALLSIQNNLNTIKELETSSSNPNFNFGDNGTRGEASVSTTIPVVINKSFALKNNIFKNSLIDYKVNVPRIMVSDNYQSMAKKQSIYTEAKAENFYSKGFASFNAVAKPTVGSWYYKINDANNKESFISTSVLTDHYQHNYDSWTGGDNVNHSVDDNTYKMYLKDKKTKVKLKVVGITNNYGNQPMIFMNKSITNLLNGYTIQGSTYGSDSHVDNNAFNAKFSKDNTPEDLKDVITYSWSGDYTSLGLNGNSKFYFNNNPYTGEETPGFYSAITGSAPDGYPSYDGVTPTGDFRNIGEINPIEGAYDNYYVQTHKAINKNNMANFFKKPSIWGIQDAFSINTLKQTINNDYSLLNSVTSEIYLILGCISLLVLFFGFKIIIYRNIKHISVLRIMGYNSRSILKEIFSFYILLAILGFIVAIPFATFISTTVSATMIVQSKLPNLGISALSFSNLAIGVFALLFFYFIIMIFVGQIIYKTKPLKELNDK